jgi:hypothetical protein
MLEAVGLVVCLVGVLLLEESVVEEMVVILDQVV